MNEGVVTGEVMTLGEYYERMIKRIGYNPQGAVINGEIIGFDTERWQEIKELVIFVNRLMDEIHILGQSGSDENGRENLLA